MRRIATTPWHPPRKRRCRPLSALEAARFPKPHCSIPSAVVRSQRWHAVCTEDVHTCRGRAPMPSRKDEERAEVRWWPGGCRRRRAAGCIWVRCCRHGQRQPMAWSRPLTAPSGSTCMCRSSATRAAYSSRTCPALLDGTRIPGPPLAPTLERSAPSSSWQSVALLRLMQDHSARLGFHAGVRVTRSSAETWFVVWVQAPHARGRQSCPAARTGWRA